MLNSGHNLKVLDESDIETIWESIFFALWYSEIGRGCEEIIAAVERACSSSYRLTRVGFKTIAQKWYGLDQYRVDKVSHLARHLLKVLVNHQIALWLRNYRRSKELGTRDVSCKKILKRTLIQVSDSYGLCYFLLEVLADEISNSLTENYRKLGIMVGKFELKANLIMFMYRQIIDFSTRIKLDARLLRTLDQYVIKRFIEEILPREAQLTQILISLRFYQALDIYRRRKNNQPTGKCKALLKRWSFIIQDIHQDCINCEYFPLSKLPVKDTIQLKPNIRL